MRVFFIFMIFYGAFSLWAQVHSFLSVDFQNDFLDCRGHGTDRYYTAGNSLTFTKIQSSGNQIFSFSIAQRAFTPSDLQDTISVNFDYPYAGLLYLEGGYQWALRDSSFFFVAAASIGHTGKYARVAGVQTTLHRVFNDEMPRGWNTILELGAFCQPRIGLAKRILHSNNNTLLVVHSLEWGTVYKKMMLSLQGSVGSIPAFSIDRFTSVTFSQTAGSSKRILQRFSFYIYPGITWVISNAILEKGLFQKTQGLSSFSSKKIINNTVLNLECGFAFHLRPLVLLFRQNWQTAETNLSAPHHFGAITAVYRFSYKRR